MSQARIPLRQLLDRSWYPFLGRFPRPTEIQERGIPAILAGENVLLASATATGKTEAYAAPLLERLLRERWEPPSLLVISPTRALANDLFRRLEPPVGALRVPLARRTGDHADWDDDRPASVVITTPESLDSLLARRPQALKGVRAVVLDELHVLDGTARGDQLAVLVTRLERLVLGALAGAAASGRAAHLPLQRVAATATAAGALEVARRYLGASARVVETAERREIEAELVEARDPKEMLGHLARRCRESAGALRKVLVFANSRADAENLASSCRGKPPFGPDVFVHHASLSRTERERVEKRFLSASSALCFATMTLELGIDIGDIDCIGLVGPPADVASLLQRTGRGNRRSWDMTRVVCFHENEGQRVRFEHLLERARAGDLAHGGSGPRQVFRPSVLVQQAWSMAFQNRGRWVDAASMAERLPPWLRDAYDRERLQELLEHLASAGWLVSLSGARFGPADRLERLFVRGLMHGNISSEIADLEVVDETTERVVGYLPRPAEARGGAPLGDEVVLGGQKRRIKRVGGKQVRVSSSGEAAQARFDSKGSPAISFDLARSLAVHLGIPDGSLKRVRLESSDGTSRLLLGHFLGSAYGRLFSECLKRAVRGSSASGNAFVTVLSTDRLDEIHFRESEVLGEISKHRRALSTALQDGPHAASLPSGWWAAWLQESLDVPRFLELVDTFRLDDECDPDLRRVLLALAPPGVAIPERDEQ